MDDPATHLELTMIHEVMILDHSGPDLALIELGAFYKLFFYSAFIANLVYPFQQSNSLLGSLAFFGIVAVIYATIGLMESIMARLRMNLVTTNVLTTFSLFFLATILTLGLSK